CHAFVTRPAYIAAHHSTHITSRIRSMRRELRLAHSRVLFVVACLLGWVSSHAQSSQINATCTNPPAQSALLNEVHTIADSTQGVPVECSFNVINAGTYQVTLNDLGIAIGPN